MDTGHGGGLYLILPKTSPSPLWLHVLSIIIIMCTAGYLYFYLSPKFAHIAEDDFHEVYCELVNIKARYYQLGIALGLPPGELEAIRKTHSQDMAQALTQVLLLWLRQQYNVEKYGRPTWQRLREAVDSPSGGNNHALAEKIAEKHLPSCCMSHHSNLSSPPSLSLSLSPPSLPPSHSQIVLQWCKIMCTSGVHYYYR